VTDRILRALAMPVLHATLWVGARAQVAYLKTVTQAAKPTFVELVCLGVVMRCGWRP
jgi:hypothetical protein